VNGLPICDPPSFIPEDFLASPADLIGVLAHLAGPSTQHSAQQRRNQRLEAVALSALLRSIHTTVPPELVPVAAPAPSLSRKVAREASRTSEGLPPAETRGTHTRPRGSQYCTCGVCKWCLDNVRWDRIYNEKFADPMYYGSVVVRHDSSLAGA
jgi:hypothetical protein